MKKSTHLKSVDTCYHDVIYDLGLNCMLPDTMPSAEVTLTTNTGLKFIKVYDLHAKRKVEKHFFGIITTSYWERTQSEEEIISIARNEFKELINTGMFNKYTIFRHNKFIP